MRITGGFLKNQSIKTPKGLQTRPTSEKLRQAVFNICQNQIEESHFLDLFAGSGAMGIEALSRGATSATFIENDRLALKAIRENLSSLGLSQSATVLSGDVLLMLKRLKKKSFELIYVDPPYHQGLHEKTLVLLDHLEILSDSGNLFVEECSLETVSFQNIELKNKRKMGNTFLFEFTARP